MATKQSEQEKSTHAVLIRLPLKTHRELVAHSIKQRRSVNAQINVLIEEHLKEVA